MVASLEGLVQSVHACLHITQVFDAMVVQVMPILTESNVSWDCSWATTSGRRLNITVEVFPCA